MRGSHMMNKTMAIALQNPGRVCMPPPMLIVYLNHFIANMQRARDLDKISFSFNKRHYAHST